MRSGKVVGTDLSALGRKIFHKGDIACENNFPPGNYQKLVDNGWIDEGTEVKEPEPEQPIIATDLDAIDFGKKKKK